MGEWNCGLNHDKFLASSRFISAFEFLDHAFIIVMATKNWKAITLIPSVSNHTAYKGLRVDRTFV